MALEVATYLGDLVPTNPPGTDSKSQGDDHLRLIKAALQATFPKAVGVRKLSDTTDSAGDTLVFTLYKNRTGAGKPVINDLLGSYAISGNNLANVEKVYMRLRAQIVNPATGAEEGAAYLNVMKAGVETIVLQVKGDAITPLIPIVSPVDITSQATINIVKPVAAANADFYGKMGPVATAKNRWLIRMGDAIAESGTRTGSNFAIYSWANDGTGAQNVMYIPRDTGIVSFPLGISTPNLTTTDALMTVGPSTAGSSFGMQRPITTGSFLVYGGQSGATGSYLQLFGESHSGNGRDIILGTENFYRYFFDYSANTHYWANNTPAAQMYLTGIGDLTVLGQLNFDSILQSTDASCILASISGGSIYFRPNGAASLLEEWRIDTAGNLQAQSGAASAVGGVFAGKGLRGKAGSAGGYEGNWMNLYLSGGLVYGYVDGTATGFMNNVACDYRMKRNIAPLGSTWEKVKSLNPIKYNRKDFELNGSVYSKASEKEEWGFLAHELQESLTETSASGSKDSDSVFQVPDFISVLSAVTASLQEAMKRIETLEEKVVS